MAERDGRTALVLGATGGIGGAVTAALLRRGWTVWRALCWPRPSPARASCCPARSITTDRTPSRCPTRTRRRTPEPARGRSGSGWSGACGRRPMLASGASSSAPATSSAPEPTSANVAGRFCPSARTQPPPGRGWAGCGRGPGRALCGFRWQRRRPGATRGAGQFEAVQQARNGGDLVGPRVHPFLPQHRSLASGPGPGHGQRLASLRTSMAAPRGRWWRTGARAGVQATDAAPRQPGGDRAGPRRAPARAVAPVEPSCASIVRRPAHPTFDRAGSHQAQFTRLP